MSSKFRILFLCCLGCFVGSVLRADDGEGLTVAVVFDGPGWYFDTLSAAVQEEVAGLSRVPVQFLFEDRFNAQWDPARYAAVLDAALTAEEVDVVFAAGVMVAQAAAVPGKVLPKPVLAGYLQDPSMIEIPLTDAGASAKENFAFVVSHERIRRDLLAVHRLFRPSRVDVLMDEALVAGMQGLDGTRAGLEETLGMGLNLIPVRGDPAAALAKVPADAEVVYVTPMLRMDDGARATLYAGLNAREIPTFAMLGVTDLRVGALAGLTSVEHPRLARRMALNLLAMGAGRSAAELPVDLAVPEQLFFNEVTLGLVGFRPSVGVLLQARFLEHADQYESGNELRLEDAVAHALVGNPDMARAASRVAEADGSRRLTRGGLGPQLSLSGQWVELDEERSAASLGMQPRSRVTAGVVLRQSIFDEMAHRRFRAAGHFLKAQTWEQADTKLDVVTEVSLRFFDALSARELVKVEEDQLERIRDLLALARLRVAVGETPREDALRWEAEEAERTAAVLVAHARAQSAMAALNVSMGLPAETPWRLAAVVLEDTETYFMDERLDFATGSFQMIRALSGFWREFGLEQSPVLQALDAAVAAQDQIVSGRRRARYLPEVGLEARVDHVVDRRTAGAGLDDVAAGFGVPVQVPDAPENEWRVAVVAEIPLFDGGVRRAERDRAQADLRELEALLASARQQTDAGIVAAYAGITSSQPAIRLSRIRAEKARESFGLVEARYQQGAAGIVEVLDAQGRAFAAEQAAVISVNTYLKDLTRFQRAISWFAWLADERAQAELEQRLKDHLEVLE